MECKPEKLAKDIDRGALNQVYFFYGPEEFLKEQAVQDIIQRLVPHGLRAFNLDVLYGDETGAAQIIDRVCALPMMAERRVVVVRNVNELAQQDRRKLLEYSTPEDKRKLLNAKESRILEIEYDLRCDKKLTAQKKNALQEETKQLRLDRKKILDDLHFSFPHTCLILTAPEVDFKKMFHKVLKVKKCKDDEEKTSEESQQERSKNSKGRKSKKSENKDEELDSWLNVYADNIVCRVRFRHPWDNQIPGWLRRLAQRHGKSIDIEASRLLGESIGNDLVALDNEIRKLAIYIDGQPAICPHDVEAVVGELRVHTVFELCDAFGFQDLPRAMALLSRLLEVMSPAQDLIPFLGAIRRHISRLAKVKQMRKKKIPSEQIAAELHIPRFYINKYLQQSANFEEEDFEEMFTCLYEVELKKYKMTKQKLRTALTLLIYRLCRPRGACHNAQS